MIFQNHPRCYCEE